MTYPDSKHYSGRVIANYGTRVLVREGKNLRRCAVLRKLGLVVTGDIVDCQEQNCGDDKVIYLHPRHSLLQRPDRRGKLKPVAANLSRLLIVSAIKPGIDTLLIDQYAAAAELASIKPLIVINKSDLLDDQTRQSVEAILSDYRRIAYSTVFIHAHSPEGVLPLVELIKQQISILVGQSGVGKSSIVKQLFPDLDIQIGALSEAGGSGAHTTTLTSWYDLDRGGALIDSPGVRQFSLDYLSQADLAQGFREINSASAGCKFNNCTHLHEPDCTVLEQVKRDQISRRRYENYQKLVSGIEETEA